jgi:hypothetical protein
VQKLEVLDADLNDVARLRIPNIDWTGHGMSPWPTVGNFPLDNLQSLGNFAFRSPCK